MHICGDDVDVRMMTGPQAALLAPELWHVLPPRVRDIMLWDLAMSSRERMLSTFLEFADVALVAWLNGQMLGMSWVQPISLGARSGILHMATDAPRWQILALARVWINVYLPERYDSLVCFLPLQFRHMRAMVEELGFTEATRIPGAIRLTERKRTVTAVMYQLNLGGQQRGKA